MSDLLNRVAVALTFDFDGFTNWLWSLDARTPGPLSRGEYDRVGARRTLALLREYGIRATFFTPGANAMVFPKIVEAIVAEGHELAHHGWAHEHPAQIPRDEERRALERGLEALERVGGTRPTGYRSPGVDNSAFTVELLVEHGFEYDSSLSGSDYEPYWCRVGDVWSKDEPYQFGRPVRLVELPFSHNLNDFTYLMPVMAPAHLAGNTSPSTVLEIWKGDFDYLHDRIGAGLLVLTMHPQVIGRGHRLEMLRAFLEHVRSRPNAVFTVCRDFSRDWAAGKEPSLPPDCGPTR
jgi:peptidoglycan/xylan/chitin deacetylase (PgdA/CDA1 family)